MIVLDIKLIYMYTEIHYIFNRKANRKYWAFTGINNEVFKSIVCDVFTKEHLLYALICVIQNYFLTVLIYYVISST